MGDNILHLLSVYKAFSGDSTQRMQASDGDSGHSVPWYFPPIPGDPSGKKQLVFLTRDYMEDSQFHDLIPGHLQATITMALEEGKLRHRRLFSYAAFQLCIGRSLLKGTYQEHWNVTFLDVTEVAKLYGAMLDITDGHYFQFCEEHMRVELAMYISGKVNESIATAFRSDALKK